jgi:hypothetical protein
VTDRTRGWGLIVLTILAAATLIGCGGEETAEPTDEPSATTTTASGGEADGDRCMRVPKALKEGIAEGLRARGKETRIKTTGDLGRAAAVRSDDFEEVYYVSAVIEGPDVVGTWATNSLKVGEGLIIAADPMAMEYSDWGEAAQPGSAAAEVQGLQNDGAQESQDCIEA